MKRLPLVMITALLLSGCAASTQSNSEYNSDDIAFAEMMIPHHEQAIEMADMLLAKDGADARVVELAEQIKAAQGPEIDKMLGWLEDWGVEYDPDSMGGMDHGSMGGDDSMMSEEDMTMLESADAVEANSLFLEQMIVHHEGAIEMAEAQLEDGSNPEVIALAQSIIESQTAEISTMQDLLTEI